MSETAADVGTDTVTIKLLDKLFHVKCPKDELPELNQAAVYLDQKLTDISEKGTLRSLDRIAIMAALNLSHELLALRKKERIAQNTLDSRLRSIQKKISLTCAAQSSKMEL